MTQGSFVIVKNNLGSAATVFKSLNSLTEKELISKEQDVSGTTYYEDYDVFYERWVQRVFKKTRKTTLN